MTNRKLIALIVLIVICGSILSVGMLKFADAMHAADVANSQRIQAEEAVTIKQCTEAGGIIIRSGWTERIVDCKILPYRQPPIPTREPHPIPQVLCGSPSCKLPFYDNDKVAA